MESPSPDAVLIVWCLHAAATWALVGLIWVVQLVLYPGFARADPRAFAGYHADYTRRMTWVVAPLMGTELVGAALLVAFPPPFLDAAEAWLGLGLVALCWASTAFVQIPLHGRLASGLDLGAQRRLVLTNWIRTAAWTLRGAGILALSTTA